MIRKKLQKLLSSNDHAKRRNWRKGKVFRHSNKDKETAIEIHRFNPNLKNLWEIGNYNFASINWWQSKHTSTCCIYDKKRREVKYKKGKLDSKLDIKYVFRCWLS